MRNAIICMVIIFLAYFVRELWTLFPYSETLLKPFPFSNQGITLQTYIWVACVQAVLLIFVYLIWWAMPNGPFWHAVFILQAAEFGEFFLCYNEAWTKVYGAHVNITTLRYLVLFLVGVYTIIKWKQTR